MLASVSLSYMASGCCCCLPPLGIIRFGLLQGAKYIMNLYPLPCTYSTLSAAATFRLFICLFSHFCWPHSHTLTRMQLSCLGYYAAQGVDWLNTFDIQNTHTHTHNRIPELMATASCVQSCMSADVPGLTPEFSRIAGMFMVLPVAF